MPWKFGDMGFTQQALAAWDAIITKFVVPTLWKIFDPNPVPELPPELCEVWTDGVSLRTFVEIIDVPLRDDILEDEITDPETGCRIFAVPKEHKIVIEWILDEGHWGPPAH